MLTGRKEKQTTRNADELCAEIKRVEAQLADIAAKVRHPEGHLGATMRLNMQWKELEAYLRGFRLRTRGN